MRYHSVCMTNNRSPYNNTDTIGHSRTCRALSSNVPQSCVLVAAVTPDTSTPTLSVMTSWYWCYTGSSWDLCAFQLTSMKNIYAMFHWGSGNERISVTC